MKKTGYATIAGLEKLTPDEIKARNLETYGSRIRRFRNRAGITAEELAAMLQISASSVRNWECGLTRPDPEFIYRMFSILNVEPNEFFGIKGIGTLLTDKEQTLINNYRALDEAGRETMETFANAMAEKAYIRKLRDEDRRMSVVHDRMRLFAAGDHSNEWDDYPDTADVILYKSTTVSRADEIITVSGASMEPQFYSGDKVLIEYCTDIRNGDIGCFYVPGIGGVIKKKAYDRLHSLNPKYDDIIVHEEGATVIGRALGVITKDMIPTPEEKAMYMEAVSEKGKHPEWFE
jgi:repressor LexA